MTTKQSHSEILELGVKLREGEGSRDHVCIGALTGSRVAMVAVLLVLVALFLFVPLLQGFQLSAGQDLSQGNDPVRLADRIAAAEVNDLSRQP
ncbi:hypothetical protein [Sandaracinobacteroides hominis]|uniref:hypothetical protein n=1 Tax=Sandaracinobacteroides hominis TaxID=2780086 RepID=UPI0018F2C122|nr:hypothetical protein [Sandaracinobacteroides hominis]